MKSWQLLSETQLITTFFVFFSGDKGMFGARKKFVEFVEVVDNDFPDESMYYNSPSMFPHRSDKDVSCYFCSFPPPHSVQRSHAACDSHSVFMFLSSDAVLSLAVVVKSAVAARCKFVCSTKYVTFFFFLSSLKPHRSFVRHRPVRRQEKWPVSSCRCTWLLGEGHGKQYTTAKPKSNSRHAATKSYHPYDGGPHHVPPYSSISEQVRPDADWLQSRLPGVPLRPHRPSLFLNRGTLPMNSRNMLNHSQVGQGIGISGRTNSMGSSGLGSPNRSSPSIICMPKQQPARQPFTINRWVLLRSHASRHLPLI